MSKMSKYLSSSIFIALGIYVLDLGCWFYPVERFTTIST